MYFWVCTVEEQHVASCQGTEDRLEATSHPRVTLNSLDLPASPPTFILISSLSVSSLTKMEEDAFSPDRVCGFINVIIPKHRFGRNPYCAIIISLQTEKKRKIC